MVYNFLNTIYESRYLKETSWSLTFYLLLATVSLILIQFLFVYFGFIISANIIFNISVLIITISFVLSIYYENITNKKRTLRIGIYINEIEKLRNQIISVLICAFSLLNIFLSYSIEGGINRSDIISIAFILSITFIPILYIFISRVKSTFFDLKTRIKELIYKDENIKEFYSKLEIETFISMHLTCYVYVKGSPNSTFEVEMANIIYEELKKGNSKSIKGN